jgi:hypothetical protein
MKRFCAWVQQPTSVAGLAAVFGTLSAVLSHQISWAQAGPLLAGGIMSVALPDNSGAKTSVEAAAGAIVATITNGKDSK